jgi:lipid-A-disaccharide synthase
MIIAGEASGDLHGAGLVRELKRIDPSIEISGIGGDNMICAGLTPLYHIKQMAFLGFIEVLRHLPFITKVKRDLINKAKSDGINTVVLIDYPGFNLNIARKLKKLNRRLIYYISPQIWAWGTGRIKQIRRLIEKMIVVFKFEEKIYKDAGVNVQYVGHPLVEHIAGYSFLNREELLRKFELDRNKEILLILPGSRKQEIKKIFPPSLNGATKLAAEFNMQIVVACAENIDEAIFDGLTKKRNYTIIKGCTYDLLNNSRFGIIKSGTSTLEAGYFQLPFIVVYSTNFFTYWLGKKVVKIKNIAMANILLGGNVVDELIQKEVNTESIYRTGSRILNDAGYYGSLKAKLGRLKEILGGSGASRKAAESIYASLNET